MNFSEFILAHSSEDPAALALSRARYAGEVSDFDLALTTLEVRRKLRDKVPEWYAVPSLVFPLRVSGEQCSSTATARYKASVALSVVPHPCTDGAAFVHGKAENGGPCTDGAALVHGKAENGGSCTDGAVLVHGKAENGGPCTDGASLVHGKAENGGPCTDGAAFVHGKAENGCPCTDGAAFVHGKAENGGPCTDGAALVHGKAENGGPCTDGAALVHGGRIADLTGGLGVDSWAFAQEFDEVLYNEMLPALADAAAHNFRELGLTNITVRNYALAPASTLIPGPDPGSPEASVSQILGSFRPDVLFLDPARRAADGRKVFRLEDCQPDVLQLLPELLAVCPRILLKLSPMADITLVCKQLGCVKAVHVVAADGECKELLLVLEKDWTGPHTLTIVEDGAVLEIPDQAGDTLGPGGPRYDITVLCHTERSERISCHLFEPGKAMLKAGAFDLPCTFGLSKLGQHTHLYVGEEVPEALRPFGKTFRILETGPLDKRSIKSFGQKYLQAEVTARNIPLTSDQLRAKLGARSGGSVHIFGLHIDAQKANYLIVAERYSPAP